MQNQERIKAMVLAAGVGSRLDPLTRQTSKPMVPVANRPVMEHIIRLLKRHGIEDIISNVHYLPEKVPQYFGDGSRFGVKMSYLHEEKLSGDAGGVRACKDFLRDGTFVVLMGDLLTDMDLSYVIEQHRDKKALATIALKQVEDVERFGVVVTDKDGYIRGFQEKPKREDAKSNLVSTGVYVLEPEIFDYMGDEEELGFGRQLFPQLVERGLPLLGVETWGYWSDVGTVAQYRSSNVDALEGLIDMDIPGEPTQFGWMGTDSMISSDSQVDGALLIGSNSFVAENVRIKGHVVIGDNCIIEPNCVIENSIIWSNSVVESGSELVSSVIAANCVVPHGSRYYDRATIEPINPVSPELLYTRIRAVADAGAAAAASSNADEYVSLEVLDEEFTSAVEDQQ